MSYSNEGSFELQRSTLAAAGNEGVGEIKDWGKTHVSGQI